MVRIECSRKIQKSIIKIYIKAKWMCHTSFRSPDMCSDRNLVGAAQAAALPALIPVILLGGIMTGWFTPTEAGVVAVAYILIIVIPALNSGAICAWCGATSCKPD